ncbi:MAG: AEC family transporter [Hyphomonadaceae bacterium]
MTFLSALIPVVIIIALGRLLAWRGQPASEGWRAVDRVSYVLLFPVMIVNVLSRASFESAPWKIAVAILVSQLLMAALGLASRYWPRMTRPAIGCVVQSNARWNTMIALAIAEPLFGAEGVALVAIVAACLIPTANILSITALSHYGEHADGRRKRHPFAEAVRNPILIACVIGGVLNVAHLPPSGVIGDTMDILGRAAVALGLLAAGAGVDMAALRRAGIRTLTWSLIRLLTFPLIAGAIGLALGMGRTELAVIVISASTPTAASGYILARELGGDGTFMANLIAVQTVLAALTMPAMYFLFMALHGG